MYYDRKLESGASMFGDWKEALECLVKDELSPQRLKVDLISILLCRREQKFRRGTIGGMGTKDEEDNGL